MGEKPRPKSRISNPHFGFYLIRLLFSAQLYLRVSLRLTTSHYVSLRSMCIFCHKLDDEKTLGSLRRNIENPCFDVWNQRNISDLMLMAQGLNGKECRCLALELLSGYLSFMEAKNVSCEITRIHIEMLKSQVDMLKIQPFSETRRKQLRDEMSKNRQRHHLSFKTTKSLSMEEIEAMLSRS